MVSKRSISLNPSNLSTSTISPFSPNSTKGIRAIERVESLALTNADNREEGVKAPTSYGFLDRAIRWISSVFNDLRGIHSKPPYTQDLRPFRINDLASGTELAHTTSAGPGSNAPKAPKCSNRASLTNYLIRPKEPKLSIGAIPP